MNDIGSVTVNDMASVAEVQAALPDPALPKADWADAYQVATAREFADAREAAEAVIANFPKWTFAMLTLRQILVTPFGLKGVEEFPAETRVGIFPVVSDNPDRLVAGFNDKHLDFRIIVTLTDNGEMRKVTLSTLIVRHNWLGRTYLQLVLPFHRAIIKGALKKLAL